jgi:small subunit ribosomal protein S17
MKERRKIMTGRVVSDKMAKTAIVEVEELARHPLYGKVIRKVRRFKAHNEEPQAHQGDLVKITESRPHSHEKRYAVTEIVQRGVVVEQIVEKELESLREKEEADRAARRADEERRAAERLAKLAGQEAPSEPPAAESESTPETGEANPEEAE